ncbi:MAG: beta-galactosidase [Clostridia bacterium]
MKKIYYGAAFYPELWDMKTIEKDIALMRDIGINVVRMGEFAWSRMEPEENKIDLSFFAGVIRKLKENGIDTVFCTPTPTPPIWISYRYPERMHVDQEGVRMTHGSRQHICTNNPYFRERVKIIVQAICEEIAPLEGVIAWQVDNELKCHVAECYCENCRDFWHAWLQKKYGGIQTLNAAWGADIWSETYSDFDQIPQPFKVPFLHNSSLLTAYKLFSRETTAEFTAMQAQIIKRYSSVPVTHNSNRLFALDNSQIYKNLDFAAFDDYPDCDNYQEMLINYGIWRNIFDKPFWVMETSPSHNGCLNRRLAPHRPGYLAMEALAAVAMGAEGFSHWLWRQQRSGCEQIHGSVISTWGRPALGYPEVKKVKAVFDKVETIILETTPIKGDTAITYSDFASVFIDNETMGGPEYAQLIRDFYDTISATGLSVEFVMEHASLNPYKMLITPYVPALREDYLKKAVEFVRNGGTWLIGPMSGYRTCEHTVHTDFGLGAIDALAGVRTEVMFPASGAQIRLSAMGLDAGADYYAALFTKTTANVLGTVSEGIGAGLAFLTEQHLGKGRIVLLGTQPSGVQGRDMLKRIIGFCAETSGIREKCKTTEGTIFINRKNGEDVYTFVLNMDGNGGKFFAVPDCVNAVTGESIASGWNELGKYEYVVVKRKKEV